ncbi:cAMP-binding domain of CRP or a regulatory subunit of cAMP-dependent protein kinases [Marinobacter daqiaonensis]|uniref:cAMP-binding domain of CRP or a regulatory subunit of cAMP-dependent protein kinases n=1 Tax=Marinobacter daqiaonensis TaxID=650891 RepID=A0A1I6HHK1_9GAMM|nr:Crp/Fnr family transcriptional regulator [Marinobacter daqiaonensis]SFR53780.1 cAMP-binding domain of CRP or a regulatory subunit of cAMP-dependent protein kinases [Marinobacter daqiaonensis]
MSSGVGESCIVRHFESYAELSEKDRRLLLSLEDGPRTWTKNAIIWSQGDESDGFYTIRKGWVCAFRDLQDGTRQVLDVYVPGDIVGLREFAFQTRISSMIALSDAELCPFPKSHLAQVFASSVTLCSTIFMITARDQAILLERLVNLGRRSAREKLAHFLVEISHRLQRTNAQVENHLSLPLSQGVLADALGLSAVHVSRTFQEFRTEGLLETGNSHVVLLDIEGLETVAGFDGCYLEQPVSELLLADPHPSSASLP